MNMVENIKHVNVKNHTLLYQNLPFSHYPKTFYKFLIKRLYDTQICDVVIQKQNT